MATQKLSPEEQLARAKMRALAQGVRVWALETYRYAVPSSSMDGTAYEVIVYGPEDISCNCPAGQNGRYCKHVGAVLVRREVEAELAQVSSNGTANGHSHKKEKGTPSQVS